MSVTITTSTGAEIEAAGDALKARGTRLTGQAKISRGTSGNDKREISGEAGRV